jgi:hypothetical protein
MTSTSPDVMFKEAISSFDATQKRATPPAQELAQFIVKPDVKQDILFLFFLGY